MLSYQAARLYEIAGRMEKVVKRLQDLRQMWRNRILTAEQYLRERSLEEARFTELEKELAQVLEVPQS